MKKILYSICLVGVLVLIYALNRRVPTGKITISSDVGNAALGLSQAEAELIRSEGLDILLDGKSLRSFGYRIHIDEKLGVYTSEKFMEDIMGCSVNVYPSGLVKVDRGSEEFTFPQSDVVVREGEVYMPVSDVIDRLGYRIDYSFHDRYIDFVSIDRGSTLPAKYDMREHDRVTPVRDQGPYGTCWAFAALGALETVSLPREKHIYSVDHMSHQNGYSMDISDGGEHTMSIAYMAAWKGPVYEEEDVYGDGVSDDTLQAEKHLEEAIIMNTRDDSRVKSAIYKYGGVETSIYMSMSYGGRNSEYYNSDTASYYYDGSQTPNHDIIIVGWNDYYPRESFAKTPREDGAYICKNSWGEDFGDGGYIYISYEDVNICNQAIVYTRIADKDNYDHIYQSDILGWVGSMGFSEDSAYFANVYTAEGDENLEAVSFYATGDSTVFKVFVVTDFEDITSLNSNRREIGKGETRYAGYYTVDLNQDIPLSSGQKYAVIVSVQTPGSQKPIAIECDAGSRTEGLDLTDGMGFMSLYGEVWHSAEEQQANICLKAFTSDR